MSFLEKLEALTGDERLTRVPAFSYEVGDYTAYDHTPGKWHVWALAVANDHGKAKLETLQKEVGGKLVEWKGIGWRLEVKE